MSVQPADDSGYDNNESLLDLPPVQPPAGAEALAQVPNAPVVQQGSERNPELLPPQPANQGLPAPQQQAAPVALPIDDPAVAVTPAPLADTSTGLADTPSPQIADDVDLIEKEWVEKAKSIVAKTKDDPHAQNQGLNQVKADYIKQRFNKELRK